MKKRILSALLAAAVFAAAVTVQIPTEAKITEVYESGLQREHENETAQDDTEDMKQPAIEDDTGKTKQPIAEETQQQDMGDGQQSVAEKTQQQGTRDTKQPVAKDTKQPEAESNRQLTTEETEYEYIYHNGKRYVYHRQGDYSFISEDGQTAEILEYSGSEKNVLVPQTLTDNGRSYTVTSIGIYTFEMGTYESIVLPESVIKMEDWTNYTTVTGYIYLPKSLQVIEAYEDMLGEAQYLCWKDSYAHRYLLDMEAEREFYYGLDFSIFCIDDPPKVSGLSQKQLGTGSVTISWNEVPLASGYEISSCKKNGSSAKIIAAVPDAKTLSYVINGLKSDTKYYYRIRSLYVYGGKTYYSNYSEILAIRTKPAKNKINDRNKKISKGYMAKISNKKTSLPASVFTTYDSASMTYEKDKDTGLLVECYHGEWACVNELSAFWDYNGLFNAACANKKSVFIMRYDKSFKKKTMVKINKKYSLVGDVVCDDEGNYYIVWGNEDKKGKGNYVTMAISKYTYSGKHVETVTFKTSSASERNGFETQKPFDAGNCSTVINDGVLVCIYAREMYNGHQSSGVIAVNIEDMTINESYGTYTSHSFNQQVIALRGGGVCYVDHGDAHPRGFCLSFSQTEEYGGQVPFHFYGSLGENHTRALLGGICESSAGIFLVGASAKSMTQQSEKQEKNLFITLADKEKQIAGSVSRKGTSCGDSCTDNGIKWLTNYSFKYNVENPQLVKTDDDRMVILWEKFRGSEFIQSYYLVLAADGSIIQKATPMNKTRLSSYENPLYKDGKIYWMTAGRIADAEKMIEENRYMTGYEKTDGKKGVVHILTIGKVERKKL